uniref:Uncharacterized protein n=1 Tax=Arundo donax TaxID=35708 RepID=A0A0A9H8L9_ARUDO
MEDGSSRPNLKPRMATGVRWQRYASSAE